MTKNESGAFHVDQRCGGCGLCNDIAPDFFDVDAESERAYIYRQPRTKQEVRACLEAMEFCPVGAIHDRGGFF